MAMKKLYMLLAAVLLMVITGCSGGGGSDYTSALSSAKAITAFNFVSPVAATGVITESTHTIAITVPYNTTSVTQLVATFTTTGTSVTVGSTPQVSGTTPNDFTSPLVYTVTAADATTQNYTVTVTVSSIHGSLDTTFGNSGMVTTPIGSGNAIATVLGIQSNNMIVAAGYSLLSGTENVFALARYNIDGSLDTTFGNSGIVTTPIGSVNAYATALVIQSNGILVAGNSFNSSTNKYDFALVRYNTDGSLDTGFGNSGIVTISIENGSINDSANALGIQSNGMIVVAGYSYSGSKYFISLVRYQADGILDTTFGNSGIVTTSIGSGSIIDDRAHALVIQSSDGILVAGSSYDNTSSKYDFALVRYNTNGSLDTTFGNSGIVTTSIGSDGYWDYAYALVIQSNGILAAGSSNNGSNYDFALVRYNTDGSLDTGFGTGGIVTTPIGSSDDYALALGIQSDGRIVVAGYSLIGSNDDFALVRYLP
jgi:uncharacterized delta-60 repeat protein